MRIIFRSNELVEQFHSWYAMYGNTLDYCVAHFFWWLTINVSIFPVWFADIDECRRQRDFCAFRCQNLPGSYRCICPFGYTVTEDQRHCTGEWVTLLVYQGVLQRRAETLGATFRECKIRFCNMFSALQKCPRAPLLPGIKAPFWMSCPEFYHLYFNQWVTITLDILYFEQLSPFLI